MPIAPVSVRRNNGTGAPHFRAAGSDVIFIWLDRPTASRRRSVETAKKLTSVQDHGGMLALSDSQLQTVWAAAYSLPVEKRGVFLGRVVAQLQLCGSRFTTADLEEVMRSALRGLIQQSAA